MIILGISCHYHESAAALIKDGKVIAAAEEERFTRKKHDAAFPTGAIAFCLAQAGVTAADLDYVVFYEKPFRKFERNLLVSLAWYPRTISFFVEAMKNGLTEKLWIKSQIMEALGVPSSRIFFVPQHLAHAAASFYPSPFASAAFLTLDAVGEWSTGSWGYASGNKLYPKGELRFPHSVGLLYSAFTAFLGFEVNDGEYKVMGMAGFGKPRYVDLVRKTFRQFPDGGIQLDLKYFSFHLGTKRMYTNAFVGAFSGLDRFDLAASIQQVAEEIILTMMRALARRTHSENLVFGGGVALNSVVNGMITQKTPFKHVFIFPAAGDDGGAVGAALYVYHHVLHQAKRARLTDVFLGPQFTDDEIEHFLKTQKIPFKKMNDSQLIRFVAEKLSAGKVVGWFEGRSEFGPRALGHRSILADPKNPEMKDTVNAMIKFREEFRPFAPVVLSEYADKYFTVTEATMTPYMLATFQTRPTTKKIAAATTHVDGTSRIQTVARGYPGRYRRLLEAFYRQTKRPILLNTSFNLKGEPIVNTPADAYSTYIRSGIHILVLENYVISK